MVFTAWASASCRTSDFRRDRERHVGAAAPEIMETQSPIRLSGGDERRGDPHHFFGLPLGQTDITIELT